MEGMADMEEESEEAKTKEAAATFLRYLTKPTENLLMKSEASLRMAPIRRFTACQGEPGEVCGGCPPVGGSLEERKGREGSNSLSHSREKGEMRAGGERGVCKWPSSSGNEGFSTPGSMVEAVWRPYFLPGRRRPGSRRGM
jgi:hypothetical protein